MAEITRKDEKKKKSSAEQHFLRPSGCRAWGGGGGCLMMPENISVGLSRIGITSWQFFFQSASLYLISKFEFRLSLFLNAF